jgi:DNA-binding NarL/FixJ family response regulator
MERRAGIPAKYATIPSLPERASFNRKSRGGIVADDELPSTDSDSSQQGQSPRESPFTSSEWQGIITALKLSPRQAQILAGILKAQTERTIAKQLGVSEDTVHSHIRRLYGKLQTHNRTSTIVKVFAAHAEVVGTSKPDGTEGAEKPHTI